MKQFTTFPVSVVLQQIGWMALKESRKPRLVERGKSDCELHYLSAMSKSEVKLVLNREDAQLSGDYFTSDRMWASKQIHLADFFSCGLFSSSSDLTVRRKKSSKNEKGHHGRFFFLNYLSLQTVITRLFLIILSKWVELAFRIDMIEQEKIRTRFYYHLDV